MTVLFLHFAGEARDAKAERIAREGFRLVVEEPRWPTFYELAKREKPHSIIIDFSRAPSHAQETTDYLSKARDTRETALFAIHVPDDRMDIVKERIPKVQIVSEKELVARLREREHAAAAEEARRRIEAAAARASSSERSKKTAARRGSRATAKGPPAPRAGASRASARTSTAAKPGRKASSRPRRKAARAKGKRLRRAASGGQRGAARGLRSGKKARPARAVKRPSRKRTGKKKSGGRQKKK
jgi:hypothetical protein